MIRIAILDLYNGQPNQGMRCLREIVERWSKQNRLEVVCHEFDVRQRLQIPDLSYHIYLSSGGPGNPLESIGSEWEKNYFNWLEQVQIFNHNSINLNKKFIFLICHSFELVCRQFSLAQVSKRNSTSFGVFPVHMTPEGRREKVFKHLSDPFYVVDNREWQVVQPNHEKLALMGAQILCIEKERPHVPYERAVMAIRFNQYVIGTQFHPEADAIGMSLHLQAKETKNNIIQHHGVEKWKNIMESLQDPNKIRYTYDHILPDFLDIALAHQPTGFVEKG